jgi:hypothetical protein
MVAVLVWKFLHGSSCRHHLSSFAKESSYGEHPTPSYTVLLLYSLLFTPYFVRTVKFTHCTLLKHDTIWRLPPAIVLVE